MELKYLEELLVLAETMSFSEAADALYTTQSTLSKHINKIETELGVKLFDRTSRKVRINKFGKIFLPYAKKIIEIQSQYSADLQSKLATEKDILVLGSIRSMAQYHITDIIAMYKKTRPHSKIKTIHSVFNGKRVGIQTLKDFVRQGVCDLAFIRIDEENDDDLEEIPYLDDSIVAVLPADHPYAKMKSISLELLANEGLLLTDEVSSIYKLCVEACRESGFEPNIVYTDPKPENLIDLVQDRMGIALILKNLASYLLNSDIAIVDITPLISVHFYLCYLDKAELSNAAKHFIECTISQREINKQFTL